MSVKSVKKTARKPTLRRHLRMKFDENPEWTDADFRAAKPVAKVMPGLIEAAKRMRGRPKLERPKKQLTLRLDADAVEAFKASGAGWQTRMNEAVVRAAKRLTKVA